MSQWVRLWDDMPTDPKWRVIARRSGRPLPEVLSVFVFMMTNAGANATERGALSNWDDEDVGAALDIDGEHVRAIREAMQGKTLDGERLSGWERRQPKREDNSADRAKFWREEQKRKEAREAERERTRTHANAEKRPEEKREDSDIQVPKKEPAAEAAAPSSMDENPKDVLFGEGLRWLRKETGKSDSSLRSSLGQMLKLAGGDTNAGLVLGVLRDAKRERKAEPVAWCMGVLRDRANTRAGPAPPQQTTDPIYLAAAKLMGEANGERELQTAGVGDRGAGEGQLLEFGANDYRRIG